MREMILIALAVASAPGAARAEPVFRDVAAEAGVRYVQLESAPFCDVSPGLLCEAERMSGGAAVADVDGDGRLDLYVTRLDRPDILFRNLGNGTFEDATAEFGLDGFDLHSNGARFADIDNDGDPDLYLTVLGSPGDASNNRFYLFVNQDHRGFAEETLARAASSVTPGSHVGFGVAFGDFDGDGWLDVHTNEWAPNVPSHSRLYRNRGEAAPGFFEDATERAGVDVDGVFAFASTFTDLDGDGWPDLAIAADFGTSRLFWNNGDGTFRDGTVPAGVGTDENGMGSTFGDFDADGDLDWFVTSIFDPDETCRFTACNWGYTGNRLYRYEGARRFTDATDDAGVRDGRWGWGAVFFDYDNDGDLDLVMTNGVDFPGVDVDARFNDDPMRFWENDGTGRMTERALDVGITDTGSGKGLLVFDYDDDGDLDVFVVNNSGSPRLYRNDGGNDNGWIRVKAIGTRSNRDAIGTRVSVLGPAGPPQVREVGTSSHFLGQSEPVLHFGVGPGAAPVERVTVRWPGGAVQTFRRVPRNTTLTVVEPPRPHRLRKSRRR